MVNKNFDVEIQNFVNKTKENLLNVLKNAIQEVVEEAETPVEKGGKMRVDTGFLRHSGVAKLNELPRGETEGRKRNKGEVGVLPEYKMEDNFLSKVLVDMKLGDSFYFGWTAKYAPIREIYDGFLETATDNFSKYVEKQSKRLLNE